MFGMKIGFFASMFASVVLALQDYGQMWQQWKQDHGFVFKRAEEDALRFGVFKTNVDFINAENAKNAGFVLAANQFAHLTNEEFVESFTGRGSLGVMPFSRARLGTHDTNRAPPAAVDWRNSSFLPAVKNQGKCGSCWAFSAIAAVEAAYGIATNSSVTLSEQQLVDCDADCRNCTADPTNPNRRNGGCAGGWPVWAFEYMEDAAMCTEKSYPYTGTDPQTNLNECHNGSCEVVVPKGFVQGYKNVSQSFVDLKSAVAHQPVSASVYADMWWQFYSSGVLDCSTGCTAPGETNHAINVVGYAPSSDSRYDNYFIVRNSWGAAWGDGGYIYLPSKAHFMSAQTDIEAANSCLLNVAPSYPVVGSGIVV